MVKAKFRALALTVLMGLGAVSPLHGVTEAHALKAPVANSAQQETVAFCPFQPSMQLHCP